MNSVTHALGFGAEIGSLVVCLVDFLLIRGVVCVAAFLLQSNLEKLRTPPKYFRKLVFSLKTLVTGTCLRRQQNGSVSNASPLFPADFAKF